MISDETLRAYERYIQSDRNLDEALNMLKTDEEATLFLKFIHILNEKGIERFIKDKKVKQQYEYYKDRFKYTDRCKTVMLREMLTRWDLPTTTEVERQSILQELKTMCHWDDFSKFTKPTNMKKVQAADLAKERSTDDEEEPEDEEMKKYSSYFQYEEHFSKRILVDDLIERNLPVSIHPRYLPILDYSKMSFDKKDERYYMFSNFINNVNHLQHIDFYSKNKSFKSRLNDHFKENKHFWSQLTSRFGMRDLLKLNKAHGRFQNLHICMEIVRRKFYKEFYESAFTSYTFDQKIQTISDICSFVERNIKFKFLDRPWFGNDSDCVRTCRFFHIILLYQQNIYDEKLFMQWLDSPHTYHYYFTPKSKILGIIPRNEYYSSPFNYQLIELDRSVKIDDYNYVSEIMDAYMEHFLIKEKKDIVRKFSKYIKPEKLNELVLKFNYLNNLPMANTTSTEAYNIINQYCNQTYLKLCHYNKPKFTMDEVIWVSVAIKNIPNLVVKLFKVNTDNYYRKNLSPFSSDINLDGLLAEHEIHSDYSHMPSHQKHIECFMFPQLKGKRGLYVVEFLGNGLSSRAIIQIGYLTLVHQTTIAGQFAFILDEKQNPCRGIATGMYFDGEYYQASRDTGRIVVPFGRHVYEAKAVIVHAGFAQLAEFKRETENYELQMSVVLHSEAVVMGNLAKLLVKPTLTLNKKSLADLRLLENTKITLSIFNKIDNITTSQVFENVTFTADQDYLVEFQVPANIENIRLNLTTTVNVVTQQTKKSFDLTETIQVNNHTNDYQFTESYLRQVDGDYQYMIRGKNGEPIQGVLVDFQMAHKYYYEKVAKCLKTDKTGIIYLGSLKNIQFFEAEPRQSKIVSSTRKTWILPEQYKLNYPNGETLTFSDKETITMPFKHSAVKTTNLQLIQLNQNGDVYIENHLDKVQIVKNQQKNKFGVNYILIQGLQEGLYQLWLKKEEVKIKIQVVEGRLWQYSQDFLINERAGIVARCQSKLDVMRIDDIKIRDNITLLEESKSSPPKLLSRLTVTVGGDLDLHKARVHAWAFNLSPYDLNRQIPKKLTLPKEISNSFNSAQQFGFSQWKNMYLNNRQMSDENRYIFERQKLREHPAGIILEKPTLLMKRLYIQDTKFKQETLNEGTKYEKIEEVQATIKNIVKEQQMVLDDVLNMQCERLEEKSSMMLESRSFYKSAKQKRSGFLSSGSKADQPYVNYQYTSGNAFKPLQNTQTGLLKIEGFQNFLAHSAEQVSNIKLNPLDYTATFDMNLGPYTQLLIVVVSDDQSTYLHMPIQAREQKTMKTRNLSLTQCFNPDKCFSELRHTQTCHRGDTLMIEDISSTTLQIIDSLQKVWMIQKDLVKDKFTSEEVKFIEVVLKWNTFVYEEKQKQYEEYQSHEMNVFLKEKDQMFFEEVVRGYLMNKMEKTLVDYWLLEMDMSRFLSPEKLCELNVFEQCLMIDFLLKQDQIEQAQDLAKSIQDRYNPIPQEYMNVIYDQVLSMNQLSTKQDEFKDMVDSEKNSFRNQLQNQLMMLKKKPNEASPMRTLDLANALQYRKAALASKLFNGISCSDEDDESEDSEGSDEEGGESCRNMKEEESKESHHQLNKQEGKGGAPSIFQADFESMQNMRQTQKLQFKELDVTKEYAETHYYKIKYRFEHQDLIQVNAFWADLAAHLVSEARNPLDNISHKFLTSNFTQAHSNLNEVTLALAMINLPFKDESHGFRSDQGRKVEIKAACNFVIFIKEIQQSKASVNRNLLVVHRYFELYKDQEEVQEFLINVPYMCQVIVTNISGDKVDYQCLVQIPEGALPLKQTHFQKSLPNTLQAFTTTKFMLYFYFPRTGFFRHFPTNLSVDGQVVAKAQPFTIRVYKKQFQVNEQDIDDVLATGDPEQVLKFMSTQNISGGKDNVKFQLKDVYWLCKDPKFFKQGIEILKKKSIYDRTFWSFSIYHNDREHMKEFFSFQHLTPRSFVKHLLGPQFQSSLVSNNPYEESQDIFNFLDYYPLVNPRVHRLGGMDQQSRNRSQESQQWILNQNLRASYIKFIGFLTLKKTLSASDRLMLATYLLMQERVTEAMNEVGKIKPSDFNDSHGDAMIQYDYIRAYLDFYQCGQSGSMEFREARAISQKYKDYPVYHWRKLFVEISDQLREIDNAGQPQEDAKLNNFEDTENERKKKLVKTEPELELTINTSMKKVDIDYINVNRIRIAFYPIDLEVLFSKSPFITSQSDPEVFSLVQPYFSEELELNPSLSTTAYQIPQEIQSKNLVIEVSSLEANGLKKMKTYYSNTLRVHILENIGELKVYKRNLEEEPESALGMPPSPDVPLPMCYVKVYSQAFNGNITFFKDGYTDLRGRFDFGQLSGKNISDVEKFAIFIQHDEHGSLIKEAKPPSGTQKMMNI